MTPFAGVHDEVRVLDGSPHLLRQVAGASRDESDRYQVSRQARARQRPARPSGDRRRARRRSVAR